MKTNVKTPPPRTHEGAVAARITPEQQLRRSVMSCMLFETEAYEDGVKIADRIASLITQVPPQAVASIAVKARTEQHLRHVPLFIVKEMCKHKHHLPLVAETLESVCLRADEPAEFLSLYWKEGKRPIAAQAKKGLAKAMLRFNEYQWAKYAGNGAIKARDAFFMCHPKPRDEAQAALFKKIADKTLSTPDTWEVELSASKDKRASWTRLLDEKVLGAMALLRNLRNMQQAGVPEEKIRAALAECRPDRVLPFRFVSAARYAPQFEQELEQLMFKCLEGTERLIGKTAIVVDNSVSMDWAQVSAKSEMTRADAACALAMLVREICEHVVVIGFGSHAEIMPNRRGFALRDCIKNGPGGGTDTGSALLLAAQQKYDRIIVITDEQSHTKIPRPMTSKAYFINVASAKNGVGYGAWHHIDGWSEACLDYIQAVEESNW